MSSTFDLQPAGVLQRTGGGSFAWDVDPAVKDVLFESGVPADSDALPLDRWQSEGRLQVVKTGGHRTVYRLALGSGEPGDETRGELYIKRYRATDWKASLRRVLRGPTSRREYRSMQKAAGLGLPLAEVVAVGGPLWPGHDQDSWLVTVGVPGSRPLDELLEETESGLSRSERRELAGQAAEIIAKLHDGGLWHGDLHAGNFLVQQSDAGPSRLVLIDLYPVASRRPTTSRRLAGLARLAASLGSNVTPSERWLFLERYLECSESVELDASGRREWAAAWRVLFCRRRESTWRRLDRHWSRGNRRLLIADSERAACRGLAFLGRRQLEHLRDRLAAVPPPVGTCVPLATGRGAVMTRVLRFDRETEGESAREAWELGHALWRRGLPVARPWLFVETDRCGVLAVPVPEQAVPLSEWSDRESVTRDVDLLMERITRAGVSIDDLGNDQLLVDPSNPDRPLLLLPTWTGRSANRRVPGPRAAIWLLALSLLGAGCLPQPQRVDPPVRHSVQSDRFTLLSDVPLRKDHWLIVDLEGLEREIVGGLALPEPTREVVVHVFASRREYESFIATTYPQLPNRRAYFVGTPKKLAVYTFWGDRIQEDLRHEFTHGILHSSLKHVPLWLDEGLAEYYEVVGPKPGGINTEYADRLAAAVANGWRPELARLEQLEHVADMQRVDYEQAWAWVHFLLHGHPRGPEVLRGYLGELGRRRYVGSLGSRIREAIPDADERLVAYVADLPTLARPRIGAGTGSAAGFGSVGARGSSGASPWPGGYSLGRPPRRGRMLSEAGIWATVTLTVWFLPPRRILTG